MSEMNSVGSGAQVAFSGGQLEERASSYISLRGRGSQVEQFLSQ